MRALVLGSFAMFVAGCGEGVASGSPPFAGDISECCECLAELECLRGGLTENRCVENIEDDGSIVVEVACVTEDERCGAVCSFLQFE